MKATAAVAAIAGLAIFFTSIWNMVSEPVQPRWIPTPTPPSATWCTPVAVPLYSNGTDCQ